MKYVGELYMYRVISASVIFEILWSLLSFGHGMWCSFLHALLFSQAITNNYLISRANAIPR